MKKIFFPLAPALLLFACAGQHVVHTSPEFTKDLAVVVTRPISQIQSEDGSLSQVASASASNLLQASEMTTLHFQGYGEVSPDTGVVANESDIVNTLRNASTAKNLSEIQVPERLQQWGNGLPGAAYAITWQKGQVGGNSDVAIAIISKKNNAVVFYAHDVKKADPNNEDEIAAQVETMLGSEE